MSKILLTLHNRTKLEVNFLYDGKKYPVVAGKREIIKVKPGHYVYAIPPIEARNSTRSLPVECDQSTMKLEKNSIIECKLIKWQLDLTVRPSLLKS